MSPAHNIEAQLSAAGADSENLADFGSSGMKTDVIAESTSGSGVTVDGAVLKDAGMTLSGTTVRAGGDRTAMITVSDGAAYTVLAANSGKLHLIVDQGQDVTLTLPTAAAGLLFKFVSTKIAADDYDWIFDTGANANFFKGGLLFIDSDIAGTESEVILAAGNGSSNSKLQVNVPSVSTVIEMYCDGTNWFLNGTVFSTTAPGWADQT